MRHLNSSLRFDLFAPVCWHALLSIGHLSQKFWASAYGLVAASGKTAESAEASSVCGVGIVKIDFPKEPLAIRTLPEAQGLVS